MTYPAVREVTARYESNTITIPNLTQQGDLIIAHWYDNSVDATAMTNAGFTKVAATGTNYGYYKYANASDAAGHTYTAAHTSGMIMLVLSNAVYMAGNTGWQEQAPSLTHASTKDATAFVLCGWYGVSDFAAPAGWTQVYEDFGGAYETFVAKDDGIPDPLTGIVITPTGGAGGARYSTMIVAQSANTVPTAPTNLTVGAKSGSVVPISWTHNDPDGNQQSKYKFRWREVI